ncbi:putative NAD(P)H-dependent oxidoreductase [Cylindrobasidium torrendii FP15055 ss-10]|uniref:Putative NAD(P)H-dependent oxidoreductase n=1 Tax=Cylindrobasidium torrendii FP15055 ss-10 TaxID=1314674 RepID=A0A0D7BFV7_9AGAR|nr:putative NAD(P)H-dependent oxidoreductase [Cylindrobasidium torrendii FP15055 ss-10]
MSSQSAEFALQNQIALVTGAGTGVGLMIAKALASQGAKVYITGRRVHVLENAAASVNIVGPGKVVPLRMDVVDEEDVKVAVHNIEALDGRLNILINNAGVNGPITDPAGFTARKNNADDLFEPEAFDDWVALFKLNTIAPFFLIKAFTPLLLKGAAEHQGTANIINISSSAASINYVNTSFGYGVSKAALDRLTVVLAAHFAKTGQPIRVNAVAPGLFPSELSDTFSASIDMKALFEEPFPGFLSPVPAKRMGTADEMGKTAIYLATNEYVNGIVITVDGAVSIVNP